MPIQFRCSHCKKMLSISTKRAGTLIVCPACTEETLVPAASGPDAAPPVPPPASPAAATPAPTAQKPASAPTGRPTAATPPKAPAPSKAVTPPRAATPGPPPVADPAAVPPRPDTVSRPARSHAIKAAPEPAAESEEEDLEEELATHKQALVSAVKPGRPSKSAYGGGSLGPKLFDDHDEHDEEEEHGHGKHKGQKFMDDTVDMTAMVDVTFLLLIFFMVTASFAAQKVFENSPPEPEGEGGSGAAVSSVDDLTASSVVVEIDAQDQMKIEDNPISGLFELREVLATKLATEQKNELLIQAQYDATHGMVVAVTDAAMEVGMQKVRRISRKADD